MKDLVIIGSGAVAAELTMYIEDGNKHLNENEQWNIVGYLDEKENIEKYWAKYSLARPVLGNVHSYPVSENESFIIGISHVEFRKKMIETLKAKGANLVSYIHPSSIVAKSAVIGEQNIIYPFCIIGPNAIIGSNNLLTSYSFISHDCTVGDDNFFSTAGLSGHASVGNANFFGIRSTVLPNVKIGSRNTIQAGMTVDKNIENNTLVFHRFKEKVIAISNPTI